MEFTDEEIEQLAHERFHHPHPRVPRKIEEVLLKAKGFLVRDICEVVGCCPKTLRNWLRDFQASGVGGLKRCNSGGMTCELDEHTDAICEHLTEHPPHTIAEARDALANGPRNNFVDLLATADIQRIRAQVKLLGSIDYAQRMAADFAQRAAEDLSELAENDSLRSLAGLASFAAVRSA